MARILLIDDDDHFRASLRRSLEHAGHTVLEASNGCEGLWLYRTEPAEIVITDILMPVTDGLETIMALRKEFPKVKIIAISGGGLTGRMDLLDVAEHLGATYTFHKPFDVSKLIAAMDALL